MSKIRLKDLIIQNIFSSGHVIHKKLGNVYIHVRPKNPLNSNSNLLTLKNALFGQKSPYHVVVVALKQFVNARNEPLAFR